LAERIATFARTALLLPALLLATALTGCAHHPAAADAASAQKVAPATGANAVAPPAPITAPEPAPPQPVVVTRPAADPPAAAGDQNAGQGPVVARPVPDLFARLRGGFQIADVDELAIDRELNWFANHPDYLERVWGRAELYLHYIVEQLDARHMPRELALLPVIESAFEPYAYSRARASGLWQFIPGTGSRYGLKQNWWYDGRRDVVASTRAALDYLQALHDEFDGDWLLAVAAYNCGELNVERAISRNEREGKPTDFWHLKLPTETRAYVPKLLAMRRIVVDPAAYGLEFSQISDVPYFAVVKTGGQIDLQVVADIAGITRDELYELNPAFHRFATDPTGPFELLVPLDATDGLEATLLSLTPEQRLRVTHYELRRGDTLAAVATRFSSTPDMLRELNGLDKNEKPAVGFALMVPSADIRLPDKAMRAAALFDRPGRVGGRRGTRPVVHVVRRGDTLQAIAQRLGTDVHTLARMNHMQEGDTLRAGQKLVVGRRSGGEEAPARAGGKASKASARTAAADGGQLGSGAGRQVTYTVRRGDTLYSIARLLQVTVRELLGWNGMGEGVAIRPGQKLVAFVAASRG
jgi:membrane-bound lytic murein transglycosylase D